MPMTWGLDKGTIITVEAELDGLLLHQQAGDLAGVIALGSAKARPDRVTHEALERADLVLNCLDSDGAGAKEAWSWWKRTYKNAKRWPVHIGKDPAEAFQKGLDLRVWVMAGLPDFIPNDPESSRKSVNSIPVNSTKIAIKSDFEFDTTKETNPIRKIRRGKGVKFI